MVNLLYTPQLSNGKKAATPWPLKIFRWTNNICWPLEDSAPRWYYAFDRFLWIFGFLLFCLHNDAEFRYLRENFHNLDHLLTGIPTYLVLIETHIRGFRLGWRKEKLKKLFQYFYAEIYVDESVCSKQYAKIYRQMLPIYVLSIFYVFTLISYTIVPPIYFLATGKRELLYKMIPLMAYTDNFLIYFPLLLSNIWIGFIVTTIVFGEANMLAILIFNLNSRYHLMRQNFQNKIKNILKDDLDSNNIVKYRQVLIETMQENLKLNQFAEEVQNEFTFRIFIIFAFSAVSLCALGFKVYTSPMTSIGYMFWTVGKIQEILAWGQVGSTIIETTDNISSMYYESHWETIIARSSDAKENNRLMKLIILAIATNRKPFVLTGLNFFSVSLTSVVTILQGAFSYFTCLVSLR